MKMIRKPIKVFIVFVACLFLLQACHNKKSTLRYTLFETSKGWGYNILVNDTLFIHQESIPALAVSQGFVTSNQAGEAAKKVLKKMATQQLPSLSTEEVQSILNKP